MHVLISGVTGFIGRYLADAILDHGHKVTGISRQADPDLAFKNEPSFELITADLLTDDLPTVLPDSVDIVYHYAAQLPNNVDFEEYLYNNVLATYNIFDYSKNAAEKFVQASTGSVYGWDGTEMVIDENTPENPYTNYALTKYLADIIVQTQAPHYAISAYIFRYSIVYADEKSNGFIGDIYNSAKTNTDIYLSSTKAYRKLDFIHIEDVIDANLAVLNKNSSDVTKKLFLIGSGQSVEFVDIAKFSVEELNSKSKIKITNGDEKSPPDIHWNVSKTINSLQLDSLNKYGI